MAENANWLAETNDMAGAQGASVKACGPRRLAKVDRETLIDSYEREMAKARWAARSVGSLYALFRFLAFCNLTWATMILLRAFVRHLRLADFAIVTALLLLEAARLASASFFSRLVTGARTTLSQNPKFFPYNENDQYKRPRRARLLFQLLQVLLIAPSIIFPLARLQAVHYDIHNLQNALRIFYILITINAAVSCLTLICSAIAFTCLNHTPEQSIHNYYNEILQRTFSSSGVILAGDFEFFDFAYKMLGREYARNVQPQAVVKHHRKLMEYLYAHRQGLDFLRIYLDAGDAFVQNAAANLIGFWVDQSFGLDLSEVKAPANLLTKPANLLTKQADKLGIRQMDWAAANSVACRNASLSFKRKGRRTDSHSRQKT